jgi:hypothetical protein
MSSRWIEEIVIFTALQNYGSWALKIESEHSLSDLIAKGIKANWEMFVLLEFVRLEYCSRDVISNFFDLLSEHFHAINASMWAEAPDASVGLFLKAPLRPPLRHCIPRAVQSRPSSSVFSMK